MSWKKIYSFNVSVQLHSSEIEILKVEIKIWKSSYIVVKGLQFSAVNFLQLLVIVCLGPFCFFLLCGLNQVLFSSFSADFIQAWAEYNRSMPTFTFWLHRQALFDDTILRVLVTTSDEARICNYRIVLSGLWSLEFVVLFRRSMATFYTR